jgi:hypothetical protein
MSPFNITPPTIRAFSRWALSSFAPSFAEFQTEISHEYELEVALDDFDDNSSAYSSFDDLSLGSIGSDDSFARFANDLFTSDIDDDAAVEYDNITSWDVDDDLEPETQRKERAANRYGYEIGDFMKSNYYYKFLQPSVRDCVYEQSRDRFSTFRSHFRVPLSFIDKLTDLFIDREWVTSSFMCAHNF